MSQVSPHSGDLSGTWMTLRSRPPSTLRSLRQRVSTLRPRIVTFLGWVGVDTGGPRKREGREDDPGGEGGGRNVEGAVVHRGNRVDAE